MLKSGDETKKLNLLKKELKVIVRLRGVKNYENLSKSRLIEEIRKLKPSEGFEKIVSEKYLKKEELKGKDIRKSFRLKKENKDIIGKEKRLESVEKIRT